MQISNYKVTAGPEGFIAPSAADMGVILPNKGQALVEGSITSENEGMDKAIEKLISAKNPVFFPGPLVLWNWKDGVEEKAKAVIELSKTIGAKIIPMPDYRPKYPMINPEVEINPNHPNLTIWHNKIDVCVFVGVHCHYANVALKIIRGGTDCYTISLCADAGHEDSMVSIRDINTEKINTLTEIARQMKARGK
ncbi:UNVERIFIED_CONTAM: CO dehydrogenase beta subunit/acetyl-CoA synthase epsilon subunit [Acetivibrio alkalicellulosi]